MRIRSTLCLSLVCASVSAQATWSRLYPPVSPSPRDRALMASHDASQSIVLLWGYNSAAMSDSWSLQGGNWSQLGGPLPPRRDGSTIVYDSLRQRLVLFGGDQRFDTWEFDGTSWQEMATAVHPAQRSFHGMAFDPLRGVTVLFGGWSTSPSFQHSDTWEWDGAVWQQRFPANVPPGRIRPLMAFDVENTGVMLHGGKHNFAPSGLFDDTWTFDGVNWQQHFPSTPPPVRITEGSLVNDLARRRVLLFGGTIGDPAAWQWDGAQWSATYAGSPALRWGHGACYDGVARRIVVFGGETTGAYGSSLGDTWQFRTTQSADVTSFGDGCVGSAGTPSLTNAPYELPWLGDLVHHVAANVPPGEPGALFASSFGITSPIDLTGLGMPGCELLVLPDVVEFAPAVAGVATWALQIPNVPALAGAQFRQQAFVLDAAANALGLTASNAIEATVGVR